MTSWLSHKPKHGPLTVKGDSRQAELLSKISPMLDDLVASPSQFMPNIANIDQQLTEDDRTVNDAKIVVDLVKWKIKQTEIDCHEKFYYLQVHDS